MTGAQIKTMCETILDDTVDETLFYQLANVAKDQVEDERAWMFLRSLDSSKTATSGQSSDTAIALPTAWRRTYKLMLGYWQEYQQVPFDEQHVWRYSSNRYCIDVANSVYYLLGTVGATDTIYHYYIKTTDDVAAATSPVWPARFHPIIAFYVAGYIMGGQDADDIFARMSPENKAAAELLIRAMRDWDYQLQLSAQNNQQGVAGSAPIIDLGMM